MAANPADVTAGELVAGRYRRGRLLGRGGMGEVREAWDTRLERPVAIKTLRSDVAAIPSARRRFETEARSAARLAHPNVVSVYDSGEDAGIPFMVMELLPGRSLCDEIAAGPMPVGQVQSLASQVLSALGTAHAAGIVHRDIKPGNILATEEGVWKVGDFGIAKSVQMQGGDETATGMVLGTPAYLAPERLFGSEATPSGDLYALGVILYEVLAAQKPFHADSPEGWAAVISAQAAVPLLQVRTDIPPAVAAAIERSIARDPAARFGSAAEMAEALGVESFGRTPNGPATTSGVTPGAPALGWHDVAPAAASRTAAGLLTAAIDQTMVGHPVNGTTLLPVAEKPDEVAAGAGAGRIDNRHTRRKPLLALAGGGLVALLVALALTAGAGTGAPNPAHTTGSLPTTTVSTLPPTTPPTTAPPPPPPPAHADHGGHGGKG